MSMGLAVFVPSRGTTHLEEALGLEKGEIENTIARARKEGWEPAGVKENTSPDGTILTNLSNALTVLANLGEVSGEELREKIFRVGDYILYLHRSQEASPEDLREGRPMEPRYRRYLD